MWCIDIIPSGLFSSFITGRCSIFVVLIFLIASLIVSSAFMVMGFSVISMVTGVSPLSLEAA